MDLSEIREWNGSKRVDLRFWKDGTVPTKEGVSLHLDQWKALYRIASCGVMENTRLYTNRRWVIWCFPRWNRFWTMYMTLMFLWWLFFVNSEATFGPFRPWDRPKRSSVYLWGPGGERNFSWKPSPELRPDLTTTWWSIWNKTRLISWDWDPSSFSVRNRKHMSSHKKDAWDTFGVLAPWSAIRLGFLNRTM
jgi:hypothetical protein